MITARMLDLGFMAPITVVGAISASTPACSLGNHGFRSRRNRGHRGQVEVGTMTRAMGTSQTSGDSNGASDRIRVP